MTTRFHEIFADRKPLIAMAHLGPLPGTPLYSRNDGIDGLIASLRADVEILINGGFEAILFCNEGDRPYRFEAGYDGVAAMTRVVTECLPQEIPFGVDFLWDANAALAVGVACGASFMREVTTGVYESDMGLWGTDAGHLLRERRRLDAEHLAIFMNITPEFASPLGDREISMIARSTVVSSLPDALLVSGPAAGSEPRLEDVASVKEAVGTDLPVLVNTGTKSSNISRFLEVADGAIVGSDLKIDGYTWNPVDAERVERFLTAARG